MQHVTRSALLSRCKPRIRRAAVHAARPISQSGRRLDFDHLARAGAGFGTETSKRWRVSGAISPRLGGNVLIEVKHGNYCAAMNTGITVRLIKWDAHDLEYKKFIIRV